MMTQHGAVVKARGRRLAQRRRPSGDEEQSDGNKSGGKNSVDAKRRKQSEVLPLPGHAW
jgi:hypothetical protein